MALEYVVHAWSMQLVGLKLFCLLPVGWPHRGRLKNVATITGTSTSHSVHAVNFGFDLGKSVLNVWNAHPSDAGFPAFEINDRAQCAASLVLVVACGEIQLDGTAQAAKGKQDKTND